MSRTSLSFKLCLRRAGALLQAAAALMAATPGSPLRQPVAWRSEAVLRANPAIGALRPVYKGQDGREFAVAASALTPLSLASADLNGDGYPDLIAGYATGSGGVLAIHFANPEAFAPQSRRSLDGIAEGRFPGSFGDTAAVISTPCAPEFLAAGVFSKDGKTTILFASSGGDRLYVLTVDGAGVASAVSPTKPASGLNWFNKNSISSASPGGDHTVVVYYTASNQPGELAGTINNLSSGPDCPACDNPQKYGIGIDYGQIVKFAKKYPGRGVTTMSPDIWTARTVAHETGHWFQQNHSQRQNCCTFAVGGKASGLDWFHFTFEGNSPSGDVLIGLEEYKNGSRQITPQDKMACGTGSAKATETVVTNAGPSMLVYDVGAPSGTQLSFPFPITWSSTLVVWNLQYELMDWTPNVTLADPTQWRFDQANLIGLCAKNPCPKEDSGTNVCTPPTN